MRHHDSSRFVSRTTSSRKSAVGTRPRDLDDSGRPESTRQMYRQSDRQRRQRLVGQQSIAHPDPQAEFVDFLLWRSLRLLPAIAHGQQGDTPLSMVVARPGHPCLGPGRVSVRGSGKWRRRHTAKRRAASIPWCTSARGVCIAGARYRRRPPQHRIGDRGDGRCEI